MFKDEEIGLERLTDCFQKTYSTNGRPFGSSCHAVYCSILAFSLWGKKKMCVCVYTICVCVCVCVCIYIYISGNILLSSWHNNLERKNAYHNVRLIFE